MMVIKMNARLKEAIDMPIVVLKGYEGGMNEADTLDGFHDYDAECDCNLEIEAIMYDWYGDEWELDNEFEYWDNDRYE